ncbi:NrsF family protein [Nguyenibacter vanlangensis]
MLACPFDDPLYVAVWYLLGGGVTALAARLVLPPLTRW